ncbi:hypothetical protein HN832_01160 [archaeon]|jgi:hypothetical protein|nr:hypothetical protein [archaeon]MBT4373820.1 hypothetical protein [archaeon]MBT4532286.1 hypothetical protein [archaeon]MBT7001111.1 hypothetical protein [archaeon]MBT7282000.1 hypothetical protein [archaeon]
MPELNIIGLATDENALEYLETRGIPYCFPELDKPREYCPINLELLDLTIEELKGLYKPGAFNLVVGGAGFWHHLNLAIMNVFHNGEDFDIYNLDNHWDTNFPRNFFEEFVDCGSHLYYATRQRRKVLITSRDDPYTFRDGSPSIEHVLRFIPEMEEEYSPDRCQELGIKDRLTFRILQEGLNCLIQRVYMTVDIDALSSKEFRIIHSEFNDGTSSYRQGYMSREHFIQNLEGVLEKKQVFGANIFGLGEDPKSFDVYDYTIDAFRENVPYE